MSKEMAEVSKINIPSERSNRQPRYEMIEEGEVRGTNMCEKNSNNGDENNQDFYLSVGIGIGLTIGAAIGVIFKNIANDKK